MKPQQPKQSVLRRYQDDGVLTAELECGHLIACSRYPVATALRCSECPPVRVPAREPSTASTVLQPRPPEVEVERLVPSGSVRLAVLACGHQELWTSSAEPPWLLPCEQCPPVRLYTPPSTQPAVPPTVRSAL